MEFTLTDADGDWLAVEDVEDVAGSARVTATPGGAYVRAHEVAGVCAALYEAIGELVPDLPAIPDPDELGRLAKILHYAGNGTAGAPGTADLNIARVLLAHGVQCPEPS